MAKIDIGNVCGYLIAGGRPADVIRRINSENLLQQVIKNHTEIVFGKRVLWISEKGPYGDMFGISEDKHIIVVEIKGPRSKGKINTGYGLTQIRRRFTKIKRIKGKKRELTKIFKRYGIRDTESIIRKKLGWSFKKSRIDYKPVFYFISSQFKKDILEKARNVEKRRRVGRYRPKIKCLLINVFKRGKKEILIIARYN